MSPISLQCLCSHSTPSVETGNMNSITCVISLLVRVLPCGGGVGQSGVNSQVTVLTAMHLLYIFVISQSSLSTSKVQEFQNDRTKKKMETKNLMDYCIVELAPILNNIKSS